MGVEIAIILGVFSLAGIFAYFAVNLKEDHGILQMLMTMLAIMTTLIGTDASRVMALGSGETWATSLGSTLESLYFIQIITFIVVLLYFIIMILVKTTRDSLDPKRAD